MKLTAFFPYSTREIKAGKLRKWRQSTTGRNLRYAGNKLHVNCNDRPKKREQGSEERR